MGNPDMEQEGGFLSGYRPSSFSRSSPKPTSSSPKYRNTTPKPNPTVNKETVKDEFSTAISWPIILAIIPTLGAFVAGSAEVWSDFIMILLILYYVYKWITVPWAYYETARSRRVTYQYAPNNNNQAGLDSNKKNKRKESVEEELRRHEFIGLIWVVISPAVAGYTLQYSRYFLSNYDKYMSTFNVTVFVLAATLKPLVHVMALLRERTIFLQSEMVLDESEMELLHRKLEMMEEELDGLRKAFATKRDLGQAASGITPSIQSLSKAIRQFEKQDKSFRSWSEENFAKIDKRVCDLDQLLYYSMEQDQKNSAQKLLVTLMFLPINLTFWAARRMTGLLPIPRALLGFTAAKSPRTTSSCRPNSRHLTHPDVHTDPSSSAPVREPDTTYHRRHATTARDPSEVSYSEE